MTSLKLTNTVYKPISINCMLNSVTRNCLKGKVKDFSASEMCYHMAIWQVEMIFHLSYFTCSRSKGQV